jgi:hypothetical protein
MKENITTLDQSVYGFSSRVVVLNGPVSTQPHDCSLRRTSDSPEKEALKWILEKKDRKSRDICGEFLKLTLNTHTISR